MASDKRCSNGDLETLKESKEIMAMPQGDDTIESIKRRDALLEYAVMHDDEAEAERLREELRKLTESARLATLTLRDFLLPLLMNGHATIKAV